MSRLGQDLARIWSPLPGSEGREWLWAEPTGLGRARLHSVPCFAPDLAPGDELSLAPDGRITGVIARSGRRVLRLRLRPGADEAVRDRLGRVEGLRWEGGAPEAPGRIGLEIPEDEATLARLVGELRGLAEPSR